jgi:hypothetical protein
MHLIGLAVVVIIVAALYRRIESIRVLTTVLWVIMLVTVATVIVACLRTSARIWRSGTRPARSA